MTAASPDDPFKGPDQTVVDLAGQEIVITLDDARALKVALLEHLKGSQIEDRDYLIRMTTQAPAWIDPDGFVRIGGWLLQPRGGSLTLTYRMPAGAESTRAYVAYPVKDKQAWKVDRLESERIRHRR
jgi:hypothetical protein